MGITITTGTIIVALLAAVLVILIIANIRIVPEATQFVIETLGKYSATWDAGMHFKMPFFSRISRRITLKEQVLDTPPQPVITSDNVTLQLDAVVYFHVFNSKLFAYGAVDPIFSLGTLSATTLRNIIGGMTLDEALVSRDLISQ